MQKWLFCPVLCLTFAFGCRENDADAGTVLPAEMNSTTNFGKNGLLSRILCLGSRLNMGDISKGVDSLEIRIYENQEISIPDQVFVIKFERGLWTASATTYWEAMPSDKEAKLFKEKGLDNSCMNTIDSSVTKSLTPAIPWKDLMDSLNTFDILNLPNQMDLPDFQAKNSDGTSYLFEVASGKQYRVFAYNCPNLYDDPHNRNINKLIHFLGKNLRAAFIPCEDFEWMHKQNL